MSSGDISYEFGDGIDVNENCKYVLIPPGVYPVIITNAEVKSTKQGDGKLVKIKMSITEGVHEGRELSAHFNIKNPSERCVQIGVAELARLGKAIGVNVIKDTAQLIDKAVVAHVVIDGEYNNVKRYSPISGVKAPGDNAVGDGPDKKQATKQEEPRDLPGQKKMPWKEAEGTDNSNEVPF